MCTCPYLSHTDFIGLLFPVFMQCVCFPCATYCKHKKKGHDREEGLQSNVMGLWCQHWNSYVLLHSSSAGPRKTSVTIYMLPVSQCGIQDVKTASLILSPGQNDENCLRPHSELSYYLIRGISPWIIYSNSLYISCENQQPLNPAIILSPACLPCTEEKTVFSCLYAAL